MTFPRPPLAPPAYQRASAVYTCLNMGSAFGLPGTGSASASCLSSATLSAMILTRHTHTRQHGAGAAARPHGGVLELAGDAVVEAFPLPQGFLLLGELDDLLGERGVACACAATRCAGRGGVA